MAIGGGVAIISTALAMPWAIASITWMPNLSGELITLRGDGDGTEESVIAERVFADAGAGAAIDDPSAMTAAATMATTAKPRERIARST